MAIEILKALQVKQARDGELSDGGGLLLRACGDAANWVLRYTAPSGKRREMGLGPVRRSSLAAAGESLTIARQEAQRHRVILQQGSDPIDMRRKAAAEAKALALEGALDAAWQQHECYCEDRADRAERGFPVFVQAIALTNVATCETALGRYDLAIERLEGVLKQHQRLGLTLGNLARTLAFRNGPGDVDRALALGSEAWPLLRRQQRATWLLEIMGVAHARRGAPELGARLIGHARAARAQAGEVERPATRRVIAAVLEELRARHGQSQVDGWCAAGAALNDDEAAWLAFESATSNLRPPVAC